MNMIEKNQFRNRQPGLVQGHERSRHSESTLGVLPCSDYAGVRGKVKADRLASNVTTTRGL